MKSWTDKQSGKCWIKDFLPKTFLDARILAYGYDANTFGLADTTLSLCGEALARDLTQYRARTKVSNLHNARVRVSSDALTCDIFLPEH